MVLTGVVFAAVLASADFGPVLPVEEMGDEVQARQVNEADLPQLEVPFKCGARIVVSQGHGTFSHMGVDRWGWDFRVSDGTPVLAAKDGVVRVARADSTRGGCDRAFGPDANYVIVSHKGGLETQYLHFSKVFVKPGQKVKAGTVLGEAGHTGFSCGSHLHFQIQQASGPAWANQSVPARFRDIGDPMAEQAVVSENCAAAPLDEQLAALAAAGVHL